MTELPIPESIRAKLASGELVEREEESAAPPPACEATQDALFVAAVDPQTGETRIKP